MNEDEPKLTIDSALDGFRKELYTVMIDMGWEEHYFEVGGLHAGDSHFVTKFRRIACVSHRTYREATTDNLIAAAVKWLAEKRKPFQHLAPDWDRLAEPGKQCTHLPNVCIPTDPLRWLLEEVREQLKEQK